VIVENMEKAQETDRKNACFCQSNFIRKNERRKLGRGKRNDSTSRNKNETWLFSSPRYDHPSV
jgi:hypothetical protein